MKVIAGRGYTTPTQFRTTPHTSVHLVSTYLCERASTERTTEAMFLKRYCTRKDTENNILLFNSKLFCTLL